MEHFIWNIDPVLLHLGPLQLRWYGLLFVGSFLIGVYLMKQIFVQEGQNPDLVDTTLIYVLIGAVIGARLMHCLAYEPDFYLSHPIEILKVWKGGLASHGGILGVVIALWLFAKRYRLSFEWLLARITIPGLLSATFIRLGNFFNSEILGLPSNAPWAVVFERVDMTPRHPVQLYESFAYLILFIIFSLLYKRLAPQTVTKLFGGLLLITVFSVRFVLEYFKTRQADYVTTLPLTTGQLLSIPFIVAGIVWIVVNLRKPPKTL
ncbi:MAG: prolipoprotein diacylglyceryl transferase [Sulfurovum sp.]|nr:prolipoprotein diacylglyceryl transferase [Sulfurovum sp.]